MTSQEKSARPLTVEETHSNAIDIVRGEEIIASIINDDGEVTDEMRAYASLFAAAPDLAALLLESRESIGGDWRERRDAILQKAGLL